MGAAEREISKNEGHMSGEIENEETENAQRSDPLLELFGSGSEVWADERADDCVERLRQGWLQPQE